MSTPTTPRKGIVVRLCTSGAGHDRGVALDGRDPGNALRRNSAQKLAMIFSSARGPQNTDADDHTIGAQRCD